MGSLQQYADDWESSSKFHYDNGDYEWMKSIIHSYKRVLEIGCGTGYSSKTLLSHGHEVLAVDNNQFCIEKAQLLLNDYPHFSILKGDIIESAFCDLLRKNTFDIVVCWNVGGEYSDEEAKKYYAKMVPYYRELLDKGMSIEEITRNSNLYADGFYKRLVVESAYTLSASLHIPFSFVERSNSPITEVPDYIQALKKRYGFNSIKIDSRNSRALSNKGKLLSCNGTTFVTVQSC